MSSTEEVRRTNERKNTKIDSRRVTAAPSRRPGLREYDERRTKEQFDDICVNSAFKAYYANRRGNGGNRARDDKIPKTYREAMRSKHTKYWEEVMNAEMAAMKDKVVLGMIPRSEMPKSSKAIKTMWVFDLKTDHLGYVVRPSSDGWSDRARQPRARRHSAQCLFGDAARVGRAPAMIEFALSNVVHASTGFTPFYFNGLRNPLVPLTLRGGTEASVVSGEEARKALSSQVSEVGPTSLRKQLSTFIDNRLCVITRVRDAMANALDKQTEYSDRNGRGNLNVHVGDLVLLDTRNLPLNTVSSVGSNKLKHRFIGPFTVLGRHGAAYTIDLHKSMTTHPTFYVGRLKRYHDPQGQNPVAEAEGSHEEEMAPPQNETELRAGRHSNSADWAPYAGEYPCG
ncbi:unnamed protein product [Phytophthora lilii]|uniref:Unnamed protein product n=1 Tax=Phytophthora lilii TaxID=2077276 RepID=A0A9W6TT11_9STRA|nr:unnamed protein product [Phytophthora lilii]